MLRLGNTKKPFSKLNSMLATIIAIENENLNLFKVFVSLYYDRTIFYPMKNISQTSELPVRSCENRRHLDQSPSNLQSKNEVLPQKRPEIN